ncbi:MAG: glycosyltransferase family 4 protein [Terriglobales bacterium]
MHAVTSSISLVLLRDTLGYLRDCGWRPAVICSPGPEADELEENDGISVLRVPVEREISPWRDLIALRRVYKTIRRLQPLVTNVGTPKAGLLVGLAAWLARVPCRIYTLRGLRLETASGWKRRLLLITERIACASAHSVICVSPSLRERAISLGIVSPEKTVVLGNGSNAGVDAAAFAPTPERHAQAAHLRREFNIPATAPLVGFVGRLTRDKGVPELVQAFLQLRSRWPELYIILFGEVESGDPLPPAVHETLRRESRLLIPGFTADVAPWYHAMDIFVLPTHREGFPNVVLEAQAAGVPVVTTTATGALDSIVDGVTGLLVPPGDAGALAAALDQLLSDPDTAARMGTAGRLRVMRDFARGPIWRALDDEYRRLLQAAGLFLPERVNMRAQAVQQQK